MSADDWFRLAAWDAAAREEFARRLARARPADRTEYQRIKANALLAEGGERVVAARDLLEKVLASPDLDAVQRAAVLEDLSTAELALGRLPDAERRIRECIVAGGPDGNGTSGEAEIQLAEILVELGGEHRVREAEAWLDRSDGELLLLARSRFRFRLARVRVSLALGRPADARTWAVAALGVAAETTSGLAGHPALGLVAASPATLEWLEAVAAGRSPGDLHQDSHHRS